MQRKTEQVIFDIEAMVPWQQDLVTGIRKGEKTIIMSGRRSGKSHFMNMFMESITPVKYTKIDQATVDNAQWMTVACTKEVGAWLRTQSPDLWHEHIDQNWYLHKNKFDVHEKIYTLIQLKWT